MGSNKHKHRSKKRKHNRSSESSENEYDKEKHRHHKKHHRDRREKRQKVILVDDDYDSANSDDDVIIVQPPPPPKISSEDTAKPPDSGSLSIDETNRLRAKLGLKPLSVSSEIPQKYDKNDKPEKKETFGGVDMGEFVHKPAENITSKTKVEKLKERIALQREKRNLETKLKNVKKLNEGSESDDDISKWVEKNRKIVNDKEQAEKRAKELDAMDEVFGIGELIDEEIRENKRSAYSAKDLKGLKVEHSMDNFMEERAVVLTLKDKGVLDEEEDTLVNVNMLDDERYKKNLDRRRQKQKYNLYEDDEFMELESQLDKKVLSKYDEEIEGEKKSSFQLGETARLREEARRELLKNKLQQYAVGKRLENLSVQLQPASEYFTEQEIQCKFKKFKKRVKKVRKAKTLKADDLLRALVKQNSNEDNLYHGSRRSTNSRSIEVKPDVTEELEYLDTDDLPAPPPFHTAGVKIEAEDDDDRELQLALNRSRKVQLAGSLVADYKTDMLDDDEIEESMGVPTAPGGSIVLNSTAEFCRTLGDIPTYGQAGNREEDVQELMDLEKELKAEKPRREILDSLTTGWNEVELDPTPIDIIPAEAPILDAEPDIAAGVAGALKLAISKGYIQTETEKRPSASRFSHLQAQNYSIEDKAHSLEDDKHSRRERYCGPTSDFKEKDGYKPNVKLEYIDDDGHILSSKEAFRYLSHKFHGKGPGKNKIEKRMKKGEQEVLMKQMSSTDTPLGTLNMLQQKQKETQSPFVVLSGTKHGQSTNIAKLKR